MNISVPCQAYNSTFSKVDDLGCRIIQTAADLFYYDFGYICMGPLALIIVISIFGRLKGHYRWFILNQAIWDLLSNYQYSCNNLLASWVKKTPTCFYLTKTYTFDGLSRPGEVDQFLTRIIMYNAYSALFLLSASRFLALYFPHSYSKLIKGRKIFYTIFLFNFITIFFDTAPIFLFLQKRRMFEIIDECMLQQNISEDACFSLKPYNQDFFHNLCGTLSTTFMLMQYFKPPFFLFLSVIAIMAVITKMAKQIKFQLNQDRKDFSGTVRIAAVIGLQSIINCFGVFLEVFNQFIPNIVPVFKLKIITTRAFSASKDYTGYLDIRLPLWLDGTYGLSSDTCRTMIIQMRILAEAFVVLGIMTGYREAIIDFIKYVFSHMKFLKNLKLKKTEISHISVF